MRTRRRSSTSGIELGNIIPSPESPHDRRRSLRLRRKSFQLQVPIFSAPSASVDEESSHVASPDRTTDVLEKAAENGCPAVGAPAIGTNTKLSLTDNLCSPSPSPLSPPVWLTQKYEPPKQVGLESLPEGRVLATRRRTVDKVSLRNIRRQIFTGQTLDEACLPTGPGVAPLDPNVAIVLSKRHVRLRQEKAKKLGFRGISISLDTERRLSRIFDQENGIFSSGP
ncbi:unnamed protein product [Calicophoron daubneyi]|uniref:Uncharacterized protein n=1 Tax=Calicophoron daubneyi TaxID=300641 RepID=A0AAV2TVM3_CALDB